MKLKLDFIVFGKLRNLYEAFSNSSYMKKIILVKGKFRQRWIKQCVFYAFDGHTLVITNHNSILTSIARSIIRFCASRVIWFEAVMSGYHARSYTIEGATKKACIATLH